MVVRQRETEVDARLRQASHGVRTPHSHTTESQRNQIPLHRIILYHTAVLLLCMEENACCLTATSFLLLFQCEDRASCLLVAMLAAWPVCQGSRLSPNCQLGLQHLRSAKTSTQLSIVPTKTARTVSASQ